jgi:Phytanoyl-CoA dioxygenase (PhyH)
MSARFGQRHVDAWRRDGGVLIERFFTAEEVAAVRADFERVFGRSAGADAPLDKKRDGEIGRFNPAQFKTFDAIPFDCSPALNLIGVHPALIEFARRAMATDRVHLYQCQAWAKFTGDADYDQPFHCDFVNHTLTAPAEDQRLNCVTILCYFSDVTEAHGPAHYVARPDSDRVAGPEATLSGDPELQRRLRQYERSSAAPAGSIFPYSIDVFHRGTNMTAPQGHRYAVMACYKNAANDAIGYHAWPFHHLKPWHRIFDHATPEQLACFGVHPPGHPFWTQTTLARAQARYPNWDMTAYRTAVSVRPEPNA